MIQALETTLAAGGYTLLLSAPEHARAHDPALLRTLLERGVDAVALLGSEHPARTFSLLTAHNVPYVMLWATHSAQGPCVGFDEHAAAALVIDHLAELGHRQIGFIGGRTDDNERARRRFGGLLEAVARRGLTLRPDALIETEYGFREGYEAMTRLLQRASAISAVICGNDYLATGALSALDRAGIAVPDRISLASFNDNDFAEFLHPPLTTVHVPIREIGEEAGRYLLARLRGEVAAAPAPLPVHMVVRRSTGPAPGSRSGRKERRRGNT
jgi:LacI family transcriptional regulator